MTPEQRARQQIDLLLQQSGWIVQDRSETNLATGTGVAIREALLITGEADYLLFAAGKAIATVERIGATLALESAKLIGFSEHNMSDSPPNAPTPSTEVYAVFRDNVNQATIQRIFGNFAGAMEKQFKHVHLLFQSSGGFVGDGICLYNFFSSLPIDLTIYNAGAVQSIALIAYLGAKKRKTSLRGIFMVHRTTIGAQPATAAKLKGTAKMLTLDDPYLGG